MPENWIAIDMGEVCKIFNGNSINEDVKKRNFTNNAKGYSFIATKDISFDYDIDYENGVKIPHEQIKNFKIAHKRFPLLCIEGGSAGRKVGFLNQDVCFGNKLCVFESEIVLGRFIYFFLQSPQFLFPFRESKNGLIGGIGINKLKELPFVLPPANEQKRIVEKIDELFQQVDLLNN